MAKPRFQVSLRFVLLWITPYVATIAAAWSWSGARGGDWQDYAASVILLLVITVCWGVALIIMQVLQRRRERLAAQAFSGSRNQFGLSTMLAAIAVASLWFGWAEVVGDVAATRVAGHADEAPTPAIVFNRSPPASVLPLGR